VVTPNNEATDKEQRKMANDKLAKVDTFAALAPMGETDLGFDPAQVMAENIGAAGIDPSKLDRVKIPAGGGQAWEIPTLDGKGDVAKELNVIIVAKADVRSYYDTKFSGGNEPPSCYSIDCVHGVGNPGGLCDDCAFSKFGTARDDEGNFTDGQACSQRLMMLCIKGDSTLPFVISAPPSSLKTIEPYFIRLAGQRLPFWAVVTNLSLQKQKSGSGIIYSQVQPEYVRTLTKDEIASLREYRENLLPTFNLLAPEPKDQD
jgi:hypothetical protein